MFLALYFRRTFNRLQRETVRQNKGNTMVGNAEVISAIRKLPNRDEIFAFLTRSTKTINKQNVKFATSDGEITLNGIPVDMLKFGAMTKANQNSFLNNLQSSNFEVASPEKVNSMRNMIRNIFHGDNIMISKLVCDISAIIFLTYLHGFSPLIQEKVVEVLKYLLLYLEEKATVYIEQLRTLFRDVPYVEVMLKFVLNFFREMVCDAVGSDSKNLQGALEKIILDAVSTEQKKQNTIMELASSFVTWIFSMMYIDENTNRPTDSTNLRKTKQCLVCGGDYYVV